MTPWEMFLVKHFPSIAGKAPNDDGWISVACVLHGNDDSSAGINVENGRYICHSPSCQNNYKTLLGRTDAPWDSMGMQELLALLNGWDPSQALSVVEGYRLEHLANDFAHDDSTAASGNGLIGSSTLNFFPVEIEDFVRDANAYLQEHFDECEIALDYASSRDIAAYTITNASIGYVPPRTELPDGTTSGRQGCLLFPYWFKDRLVGVRIRQANSRKRMLLGSHYVPYNINSVFNTTARTVVVGEGESDTIRIAQALAEYGFTNVPVIGTPGDSFNRSWSRFLKRFQRVLIVPQADEASQRNFATSITRTFEGKCEIVQLPWDEDAIGGKDVCDFLYQRPDQEKRFIQLLSVTDIDTEDRPFIKSRKYFEERKDKHVEWIIPGVIEKGSKVLLLAEPKAGKTFIVLDLIQSLIHGTPLMGKPEWTPIEGHVGTRCLLIEEEGSERALGRRILTIIDDTDALGVIHRENLKLDDPTSLAQLRAAVVEFRPQLIVFDPYASLHNQDENEVKGTQVVLDALNTLYRASQGATIVVIHHVPSDGRKKARGSTALWGACDSQFFVTRDHEHITVEINGREVETDIPYHFTFNSATLTFVPTMLTTVKVTSHKKVDAALSEKVQGYLAEQTKPVTQNDIMDALEESDTNAIRTVLQALVESSLVARAGTTGRNGYTYTWIGNALYGS